MSQAIAIQNGNSVANTESTKLAQFGELSVQGIIDRKRKIGEIMKSVMREGEHYGRIPGCGDKPALYKAGAEILATTFALAPRFKITKTDLPGDHREYEIICTLVHIPTGLEVGDGVGSCSTMESKYRWRAGGRKCPECGAAAIMKSKYDDCDWFCFGKKGGCGAKFFNENHPELQNAADRIENPDCADQWNTVLKMAKKRAQVDATLTATGASDILTQDIEDLPQGTIGNHDAIDAEYTERPAQRANGNGNSRSNGNGHAHAAPPILAQVDNALSIAELEALAPALAKLDPKTKAEARRRYGARKQWLKSKPQPAPRDQAPEDHGYSFDPEELDGYAENPK